ncbi:MAG: hypothetical protein M3469_08450, partial [Actinomycetota bacterium]|nr:hypothetical protein [Actinomycetota bacterium]
MITAGEHRFEVVKRAGHPAREVSDARMGWVGLGELRLDLVGRPFPDSVEPVDEDEHLGTTCLIGGVQRRDGVALLEVTDDLHRVDHHGAVVLQDRDEPLAADALHLAAIAVVDDDRLDGEPLVGERQRDAFYVGRERGAVEPDHCRDVSHRLAGPLV